MFAENNSRRGQAALEFLTTYGWALLVILVMVGALVYFGLLNPNRALPNRCDMPPGFACKDFQIRENGFDIIILNKNGDAIKSVNLTALPYSDAYISSPSGGDCGISKLVVSTDEEFTVQCNTTGLFQGLIGSKVKINFGIGYTPSRATYAKTAEGTIFGPVQQ